MHMSDALISPAVGAALWAGSAATAVFAVRRLKNDLEDKKVPLMGVMGAFVFAAQMINFTIPGTGSSGHIGGGMLLAILLGPDAGFLTMASVLIIQALLFADGGLLAFGCNLINLGFFTCYVAYPLIFRPLTHKPGKSRLISASVISTVLALQAGAFSVVLETVLSGKTDLPFLSFLLFMQPIHLVIGLAEGFVTAAAVVFLRGARPDLVPEGSETIKKWSYGRILTLLVIVTLVMGGLLSWFASANPDGLEWSIEKAVGSGILSNDKTNEEDVLSDIQGKTAVLPDYQFKNGDSANDKAGTSFSGIIGSAVTLAVVAAVASLIHIIKKRRRTV